MKYSMHRPSGKNAGLTVLLAVLLTAVQVFGLIACSETASEDGGTVSDAFAVQQTAEAGTSEEALPEETEIRPDLPDKTFGGAEFRILQLSLGEGHIHSFFEYDTEELTGELLNDAIYNRNLAIEAQYDTVITAEDADTPQSRMTRDVKAGETSYQAVADWPTRMASLSAEGALYNLRTVPWIDLEKPWWDGNAAEAYSVRGKQYLTTGDYVLYDKQRILIFFFNHDMADNFGIPDLYGTVWEGEWTVDRMNGYVSLGTSDLNGDGKLDCMDDSFGMISGSYTYMPYLLFGMGCTYSKQDGDGNYSLNICTEHTVDVIGSLAESFYGDNTIWWEGVSGRTDGMWHIFEEGRGLFFHEVSQVIRLMDMDQRYGILPQPKYDTEQEFYMTAGQSDYSAALGIPVSLSGETLERTGIMLEALSALSHTTTYPTFIEDIMQMKKAPDPDSAEILKMIHEHIVYDLFSIFKPGNIQDVVAQNIYKQHGEGFVSAVEKNEKVIMKSFEKLLAKYDDLP